MSKVEHMEGYRHALGLIEQAVRYPSIWYGPEGALGTVTDNIRAAATRFPADYGSGMLQAVEEVGRVKAH